MLRRHHRICVRNPIPRCSDIYISIFAVLLLQNRFGIPASSDFSLGPCKVCENFSRGIQLHKIHVKVVALTNDFKQNDFRNRTGRSVGPGVFFLLPCIDDIRIVDLRTITCVVNPQEILTKDSVTVSVDAVVYHRVSNPLRAVIKV